MTRAKPANHTFDSSNTRHNITRMLAFLAEPRSYTEIEEALHMSPRSVRFYVQHLRNTANRRLFVQSYKLVGGRYLAFLKAGNAPDAALPPPQGSEHKKARDAARRAKIKACKELSERAHAYEKARWAVKKALRQRNTWAGALGVAA